MTKRVEGEDMAFELCYVSFSLYRISKMFLRLLANLRINSIPLKFNWCLLGDDVVAKGIS